jgi:hypothetical protein
VSVLDRQAAGELKDAVPDSLGSRCGRVGCLRQYLLGGDTQLGVRAAECAYSSIYGCALNEHTIDELKLDIKHSSVADSCASLGAGGAATPGWRVGASYSVTSCDLRVLMDQSTESISPHDAPSRHDDS